MHGIPTIKKQKDDHLENIKELSEQLINSSQEEQSSYRTDI